MVTLAITETSETLTITRTWANADVLIIDSVAKTVQVNGSDVDFTGPIFELEPGTYKFTYSDEFTLRNVNIDFQYLKRYL